MVVGMVHFVGVANIHRNSLSGIGCSNSSRNRLEEHWFGIVRVLVSEIAVALGTAEVADESNRKDHNLDMDRVVVVLVFGGWGCPPQVYRHVHS